MASLGIVLGFFQDLNTASTVLGELRRKRFHKSAVIHRDASDKLLIRGGVTDGALISRYRNRVLRNETLVLVQAADDALEPVYRILSETRGGRATIFVFPSPAVPSAPADDRLLRREPLPTEQLATQAIRLARALPSASRENKGTGNAPLRQLAESDRILRRIRTHLTNETHFGRSPSLAAAWLLDNEFIVQSQIDDVRRNLPHRFYDVLPTLSSGPSAGVPRIYEVAREMIADTDALLDRETIRLFLQSFQTVTPLTISELWAAPLMLRLRLIDHLRALGLAISHHHREREQADFWASRLLSATRRDPDRLTTLLAEMEKDIPAPSPFLADQMVGHLYDEEAALSPVRNWLERKRGASLPEIILEGQRSLAAEQVSVSHAITSLRHLTSMDWRTLFEAVNPIDALLARDPARVYARMDFATRDRYRGVVEDLARRSHLTETAVAEKVVEIAEQASDELRRHIGFYLDEDEGQRILEQRLQVQPRLRRRWSRFVHRRATPVYLGTFSLLTFVLTFAVGNAVAASGPEPWIPVVLALLAVLPASEIALQIVNYLITRLLPPVTLNKMSFAEGGIPEEHRTLVVVPTMLLTPDAIRHEVERLEIRYLANPDPQLRFGLLSDFADAEAPHMPEDAERLDIALQGIDALNRRYGPRFYLFHRDRQWSETEQKWIGWERKRGKLEQLNAYLMDESDAGDIVRAGDTSGLAGVRFVITLDADTELPRDTARRLVETLAHPLNRPHLSSDGKRVVRGYTILQPRVTTTLPSATATLFTRVFTDTHGLDPYTHAVSDVYQDLTGEGSYHGKGIYDLEAFHSVLSARFPESHLLSHDLIEGCHVRVGLVSDIELLDSFPTTYAAYARRQHRWVRGDWQIVDWLRRRVPTASGRSRNPLSLFSRWKIADNLRRSLLPAASIVLLVASWVLAPGSIAASVLAGLALFLPALLPLVTWLTVWPKKEGSRVFWQDFAVGVARAAVMASLQPHQAAVNLDAIGRVWYRRHISRRRLLQWQTASETEKRARNVQARFLVRLGTLSLPALALSMVFLTAPDATSAGSKAAFTAQPFLLAWIVAPALVAWLNTRTVRLKAATLADADKRFLRQAARQTWRYFDEFMNAENHWLPPDNYQEFELTEVAPRTSPTNIGLGLLAPVAARDFGFITVDEVFARNLETIRTLYGLERYDGHLLNWYDTRTLRPLEPRYVSTVDSGNFLGAIWTLEQAHVELRAAPVVDAAALQGLSDTLSLLNDSLVAEKVSAAGFRGSIEALETLCTESASSLDDLVRRLRQTVAPAAGISQAAASLAENAPQSAYWAAQVERQVLSWNGILDRYLSWVEALAAPPQGGLLAVGPDAHEWRRLALTAAPSLQALSAGDVPGLRTLLPALGRLKEQGTTEDLLPWIDRLVDGSRQAQQSAVEKLAQSEEAASKAHGLSDEAKMRFLYQPERRLFSIGYNVTERRLDNSYYDLLASEARLGSLVAIACGDVPTEHWWALGRPFGSAYGERPLLSWSGTAFEYLMPILLTRPYENSLLRHACETAVDCQKAYGARRGVPWGISESAHSALDANRVYQYYAFGVPGLGLKRGLEEDLVVAPYATVLALPLSPQDAVANLRRLDSLGMRGPYGYYEAIDYNRQTGPGGERGVPVQCFMAHHQGMSLLAIDNTLNAGVMQNRFHADPRVQATESLLFEKIPGAPAVTESLSREAPPPRIAPVPAPPTLQPSESRSTGLPQTHLLSNGRYSVMLTDAGSGYSRWKDMDVFRWRSDTTRDAYGSFTYLRDPESGTVWTCTYQPVRTGSRVYTVQFTPDKAEFRRRVAGIESQTEIIVSPEDDAEIRRITLVNRSRRTRHIEITTYSEIALAPHNADRAHPAFSKMFVETEAVPALGALAARRKPRSSGDPVPWIAQILTVEGMDNTLTEWETDRLRFLGRGRSPENPAALSAPLSNTAGAVLDPIFSIRRRVTIDPGERLQVAAVTVAGDSREQVLHLAEKYRDPHAVSRAFEVAWNRAQIELRHLRIQPDEAQRYQQLASYVLYPHLHLRPASERLRRNTLGQSRLWAYGISGDLPIVAVTIGDLYDSYVVRQVLMAHTYWRLRGMKVDLVILNEESASYEQPLHDQLRRLVQAHSQYTGTNQSGGVFLLPARQIPEEDLTLILTAARAVLVAARGSLAQQLATPPVLPPMPAPLQITAPSVEEPSPPLPFLELPYFNGTGGFTENGEEYAIFLGPEAQTPAPWINVMANPSFGTLVSESGSGFTWYGNSQSNRLTPWSNDPVSDPPGDALYIRDEDMGVVWSPTPLPIRERDPYRARHGQGYTVFEHNSHAIEQELLTFVPVDESGGAPVRIQRLRLRNHSSRTRRLTITAYAEWTLGTDREETQPHIVTTWDSEARALFARNAYHPDFSTRVAFAAAAQPVQSFTSDRAEFLGHNGSLSSPAALRRTGLSNRAGAGLDPCAALQITVSLEPRAQAEVVFLLGQAATADEARALVRRFRDATAVEQALDDTRAYWDATLGALTVKTPDKAVDYLLNRWLLYQDLSCRTWGRSAFYQSGGAFGFRDQLQDSLAFLYSRPQLTREQILRSASRQFVEGDVQHWWHPPSGAGVRTRISDDLLWLPFAAAHYVRVTGDLSILDETAPFLEGRLLEEQEHEIYFPPGVSGESATLLEHCRRAIEKGDTSGPNGLPLIGGGDWNDGMNRVGIEGKGESVWLAWFLIQVLTDFAELLTIRGDTALAHQYRERSRALTRAIEEHAWDGAWYRRAYFDDGTPLGSAHSEEARIDSLAQSWSVIAGTGDPARAAQALRSVEEHLVRGDEKMVLLFTPPFEKTPLDPGYIKGYPAGVRENGGQYTHGSLWVPIAFARRGDGDTAVRLLQMMNPVEHARTPEDARRYVVEPYVVAADVYTLKGHIGRGGWTWYTGSAGWMYRAWVEEVLGFRKRGNMLAVDPRISSEWHGFTLRYRYGSACYEIAVENPDRVSRGVALVEMDGERLPSNAILLHDDGRTHHVRIRLGSAALVGREPGHGGA